MPYRSLASLAGILAVTSLAGTSSLHAQAGSGSRFHGDSTLRGTPARYVIHCGPAPLTERPGSQARLTQARVAPLESAFAAALRAKRSVASLRIKNER